MDNPLLIGKTDFAGRIDISDNLLVRRINEHILHAQDFDLCDLMGDRFYYYFMSFFGADGLPKPGTPETIINLFNGGNYTVEPAQPLGGTVSSSPNEFTFLVSEPERSYPGIKPVLVYFTGARLVRGLDAHVTPTGIMAKLNDFSEHVSVSSKNYIATQHNSQALAYWQKNLTYLELNKDLYPQLFETNCRDNVRNRSGKRPRTINL